jgi:hypothetical protein
LVLPEENPKDLDQDGIIEIRDKAKARDPECLIPTLKFLKRLMRNMFIISINWRILRKSSAQTVQIHNQLIIRKGIPVNSSVDKIF